MAKIKPATPEELQVIKNHFQAQGYGVISDETAHAQKDLLKMYRQDPQRVLNHTKDLPNYD